ncbi:nitrous oxide-stimulated promoter family protein [Halarcobacter sp.]|uniref:nitrous oxide-stimulated promoter family protein n=1 Tax=Halarcobacter sp. TaxID=2321133 RepID=UPI0029F4A955|nr:nitrous oxide-stimulated promoter family protein [Halarcobacter sp.]
MKKDKFKKEINTLKIFFELYCKTNHKAQNSFNNIIKYQDFTLNNEITLCNDCKKLFDYSVNKLQNCPHEEKPRCRKCPNPCYEKDQWKALAKIMRSSGLKLGLLKIKNLFS